MKTSTSVIDRPSKRLLSIKEAGDYLGRSAWGMRAMVNTGKVPYVRIDTKIQFDVFDLDQLIERHRHLPR